jgi:hypothetical protein
MKAVLAGVLGLVLSAGPLQAAVIYSYDDGTAEAGVRGGLPRPADLWIANGFTAQAGGTVITSIDIAYGAPVPGAPAIDGAAVQILLYDDPSNDMDPTDAVLLTSVATVASNGSTNTFVNVPITPTSVSGDFFVAALLPSPVSGAFGGGLDVSVGNLPVSWVAENTNGIGLINPANVAGTSTLGPVTINSLAGSKGVLLIRANGVVPEPATLAVALLGACALGCARRRG